MVYFCIFLTLEWKWYESVRNYGDCNLTALMSPARIERSISHKTSVSVSQLTGCFPFPAIQSWRISVLIRSASSLYLCSILRTLSPVVSSKRRMPKLWYLVPISWGILIFLSLPSKLMQSGRVGQSAVTTGRICMNT